MKIGVSGKWDSDPRPSAWEADALPTELLPRVLVMFYLIRNINAAKIIFFKFGGHIQLKKNDSLNYREITQNYSLNLVDSL